MNTTSLRRGLLAAACLATPISISRAAPILQWNLEEGSGTVTTESISGESSVATIMGSPTWTGGIAPGSTSALDFTIDGPTTPSYIDAGTLRADDTYVAGVDASFKTLSNNYTITAWIESEADYADDLVILSSDFVNPGGFLFFTRSTQLGFDFLSTRIYSGLYPPTGPGRRNLVALIVDSSGANVGGGTKRHRFAMWDGTSWRYSDGTAFAPIRLQGLEIGSFNTGQREFLGTLDEVTVYDHSLSQGELDDLLDAPGSPDAISIEPSELLVDGARLKVEFDEPVTGFDDATDLVITHSGTAHTAAVISGGGQNYTVDITGLSGSGSFTLAVNTGSDVVDFGGNPLASSVTSAPVTFPDGTAITWTNPGSGQWQDGANWDLAREPGVLDDVFINNGGSVTTVLPNPVGTQPIIIGDLNVGTGGGSGDLVTWFDSPLTALNLTIGEGGGTGTVEMAGSPNSNLKGGLDIGLDGGTGTLTLDNPLDIKGDARIGVTANGAALSTGTLVAEDAGLRGDGTNTLYLGQSLASGAAIGSLNSPYDYGVNNFATAYMGRVDSTGDGTALINYKDRPSFGFTDLYLGYNNGGGTASGTMDIEMNGGILGGITNLHLGASTPSSTGDTHAGFMLSDGLLSLTSLTMGSHQGSGIMNSELILALGGPNRSSGINTDADYAAVDLSTATLDGTITAQFNYLPDAGTTTYELINSSQSNGLGGTPTLQTRHLNRGFSVDLFEPVMSNGTHKLTLQISGSPLSSEWSNPATGLSAGNWFSASNWSSGLVPDPGEPAFVSNGGQASIRGFYAGGNPAEAFSLQVGTDGNTGSVTMGGAIAVALDVAGALDVGTSLTPAGSGGNSNGSLILENNATVTTGISSAFRHTVGGVYNATAPSSSTAALDATNSTVHFGDRLEFGLIENSTAPATVNASILLNNSTISMPLEDIDSGNDSNLPNAGGTRDLTFSLTNGSHVEADDVILYGQLVTVPGASGFDVLDVDIIDSTMTSDSLRVAENIESLAAGAHSEITADLEITNSTLNLGSYFEFVRNIEAREVDSTAVSNVTGTITNSTLILGNDFEFVDGITCRKQGAVSTMRGTLTITDSTVTSDDLLDGANVDAYEGSFADAEHTLFLIDSSMDFADDIELGNGSEADGTGSHVRNIFTVDAVDSDFNTQDRLQMASGVYHEDGARMECDITMNLLRSSCSVGGVAEIGDMTFSGLEVASNYSRAHVNMTNSRVLVTGDTICAANAAEANLSLDHGYMSTAGVMQINPGTRIDLTLAGVTRATSANVFAGTNLYSAMDVTGDLVINGGDLNITVANGPLTAPAYVLLTYGSLTGSFDNVTGIPPGYVIDYAYAGGTAIALVPGTAAPYVVSITPSTLGPLPSNSLESLSLEVVFSEPVLNFDNIEDILVSKASLTNSVALGGAGISMNPDMVTYTVALDLSGSVVLDGSPTGSMTFAVNAGSDVTGATAVPLIGSAISDPVIVDANPYQQWAMENHLSAGVDFDQTLDPDGDSNNNAAEWLRGGDPLVADVTPRRALVADFGGAGHLTLTIPTPATFSYLAADALGAPGAIAGGETGIRSEDVDFIGASTDLTDFNQGLVVEEVVPALDGLIPGVPALPAPPAGYIYRTFRLADPVTTRPRAFMRGGPMIEILEP